MNAKQIAEGLEFAQVIVRALPSLRRVLIKSGLDPKEAVATALKVLDSVDLHLGGHVKAEEALEHIGKLERAIAADDASLAAEADQKFGPKP